LSYSISLDERLQQELVRIPSLLTQPFVENALRHGLLHKEGAKKLSIEFTLANDSLTIRVDDNGVGRKTSAAFNKSRTHDHRSFAIAAYQKRIDLLNSNRSRKIELSIIDKHSEQGVASGTTVVILVPLDV
jgi:LytS/YehU family sensor histidine kinase